MPGPGMFGAEFLPASNALKIPVTCGLRIAANHSDVTVSAFQRALRKSVPDFRNNRIALECTREGWEARAGTPGARVVGRPW